MRICVAKPFVPLKNVRDQRNLDRESGLDLCDKIIFDQLNFRININGLLTVALLQMVQQLEFQLVLLLVHFDRATVALCMILCILFVFQRMSVEFSCILWVIVNTTKI